MPADAAKTRIPVHALALLAEDNRPVQIIAWYVDASRPQEERHFLHNTRDDDPIDIVMLKEVGPQSREVRTVHMRDVKIVPPSGSAT